MKNNRLSDDFINLNTQLMLATERSEILRLAADFNATIGKLIEKEKSGSYKAYEPQTKSVSMTLKFTTKEISKMAKTFKKEFIANGLVAHVIKRESGKNSYCYEIRYRSNGYKIEASSTDLAEAKRKFLGKTIPSEIEKYQIKTKPTGLNLFEEVFSEWYSFKSKTTVTEKVLQTHKTHFNTLPEFIRKKPIATLTTENIASCLEGLADRMYEEYRTLFNMLFKYANANGLITHNPMGLIPFKRAKRQTREALSEEEIKLFLKRVLEPKFDVIRQRAYFYYFFGLRASELDEETRREGDFLITRNRKRKNGSIEYKKIPISKAAETLIGWDQPLYEPISPAKAGDLFHALLGEERSAYNLRHTFATLCQQYVRPDIVDIWMGDSSERLVGRVYTHFPDNFMKKNMDLVIFPII